jgi:hypothetical protein
MAPLLSAVPPPIFNWMGTMPCPAMQALFDGFFPKGLQWYWKGDFVKSLPDEAIDVHIAEALEIAFPFTREHSRWCVQGTGDFRSLDYNRARPEAA